MNCKQTREKENPILRKDLSGRIKEILYGYVQEASISNTADEKKAQLFFLDYFGKQDYFQRNPQLYGAYPIEDDPYDRAAVWAMVKGEGSDTVVLIHHNDVVTVEDFKLLKDYAFAPDALEEQLWKIKDTLAEDAREDLESGDWLFGRGVCDMKGGGAIQMALLTEYAKQSDFRGNVIVLGVPDEENLSAGMRAGVILLDQLRTKYGLTYRMMINSEPHQRKKKEEGIFSFGSIGKLMPWVYVRGSLAHAGKVFEGLNPANVMCEIVRRTEVNMDLSDVVGREAAPPPTWLYLRENKLGYDVSMPLTITGCLSVLTLNQSPQTVMQKLKGICKEAFERVIEDMNRNYRRFTEATGQQDRLLPWQANVVDFGDLYEEAKAHYGTVFTKAYEAEMAELAQKVHHGEESLITANFHLVDFVYDYISDLSPRVVLGLCPPYYPNVANVLRPDGGGAELPGKLFAYVQEQFGQVYTEEHFYTGISDLSYSGLEDAQGTADRLKGSMPFYGNIYTLPLQEIRNISMPCVNIGPWGKDFHKLTERVYKIDLYERTPLILDYAIREILQ